VDGSFLGQGSGSGEQGGGDAEDPAWRRGPGQVPGGEDPSVLDGPDAGYGDVSVGPGQEPAACGGGVAGPQDLRGDPAQWRVGDQGDAGAGGVAGTQPVPDLCGEVAAVERGDVGGVDGVEQVAGGEDAGCTGAQGAVDAGSAGGGVDVQAGGAGEFAVGDPVPGGNDGVAADGPPRLVCTVVISTVLNATVVFETKMSGGCS
jgi:hypothetical protein